MLWGANAHRPSDFKVLKDMGFDFAEILLSTRAARRRWWEAGVKSDPDGFLIVAHGPLTDSTYDQSSLWDHYLQDLKASVDTASRLGIKLLTIHMDISRQSRVFSGGVSKRINLELFRREKLRSIQTLVAHARKSDVTIALENVKEDVSDLREALKAAPDLRFTLDVGHGQLNATRNRAFDIIRELGHAIAHVHLHDNNGLEDLHLAPGKGIIDIAGVIECLRKVGYDSTLTFEAPRKELGYCRTLISNPQFRAAMK
jgi:sugar phosphate isomerase/epimerase